MVSPYPTGILGNPASAAPGGLLGGAAPYANFGEWMKSNPQTVTALAAGLLAGRMPNGGWNLSGVSQAQGLDRQTQMDATTKAAINGWLKAGGPTDVQHPATAALFAANPRLAEGYITSRLGGGDKNKLMSVGKDSMLYDAATGKWITPPAGAGGPAGPYEGTAMDAQDMNILLNPNADPSSPTYAAAYTRQYLTPHMVQGADADGHTIATPIMPPVPPGIRPPANMPGVGPGAAADGPASPPGAPIITGTKPPTDTQLSAGVYADRMMKSNSVITKLEKAGTNFPDYAKSGIPVVGNYLISDDYRQLDQAERDFLNAVLRRESGAVISDNEFANGKKQYFPQPGDDPKTIEQKRANRETAIAGISRAAGPGYKSPSVDAAPSPAATDGGAHDWTDLGNGVKIRVKPQ